MSLKLSDEKITFKKGIIFRRIHTLPPCSVVRITVKRSPILRLFRVKQAELFTRNGSFKLFLRRDERLPFDSKRPVHFIKPRFRETAFGAFIDVRALGSITLFAAVMRRIGTVFGGKYLDRVLEALDSAAVTVEQTFSAMRVYVPRVAAALGVFALAAWAFAYFRRLAALARFRVGRRGGVVVVESGLLTLYEHVLVPNSAAVIICDSPVSLLAKHAPVYLRGVMIYPSANRASALKLVHILSGGRLGKDPKITPPKSAWFGYCAVPLWWSVGFAAALALVYIINVPYPTALLKTALYCGLFVSVYMAAVYLYYMGHSGIQSGSGVCRIAVRRSGRLYTAVLANGEVTAETVSQNMFQRRSGLCNLRLTTDEPRSLKARLIALEKVNQQTDFKEIS